MDRNQRLRLLVVVGGITLVTLIIIGRLFRFQIVEAETYQEIGEDFQKAIIIADPRRGTIYDRNMGVLAGNGADYRIGASPSLVTQPEEVASALAPMLDRPRNELLRLLESENFYVPLSNRRVPAAIADEIRALEYSGIQIDPVARRIYPQGELACHVLGYTNFDGEGTSGLEGYYQTRLAGEAAYGEMDISPLTIQYSVIPREGSDLVLTIDRSVQFLVESHLERAMQEHRAESGSIIVMNPRTGAILAMANSPCYSPYQFYDVPEEEREVFLNPSVSKQFEPGSVMKLITMAAAIDSGTFGPSSTYYDPGYIELGGQRMYNWDRSAPGTTDMETLLSRSLNVGAATLASTMGSEAFYNYMIRFGFGQPTRVDLMSEALGQMPLPGDALWTETNLGTNSFGQGMAVTPLQMISAISALANEGAIMQPYLVQEVHTHDGEVFRHEPAVSSRPISAETAQQVSAMAVNAVRREVPNAQVEGFTVAGKTSSAQIPEGGVYDPNDIIGVFVGWLPADNPEVLIMVKLDRPQSAPWGSQTAAPVFGELASELVVLLDIPPDSVRLREDIARVRSSQRP